MAYSTFDETNPLLSNNPFHDAYGYDRNERNYYQSQELTRTTHMHHSQEPDTMGLERDEEKMVYITEELSEMKDLFGNLQDIVDDEQEVVDVIETGVHGLKDDVLSGTEHLVKAEKTMKKIRCNRCFCLIVLVGIICLFLLYLWFTTQNGGKKM
eukprot:CAMPEP_0197024948 /NCGR_PEP_ID=MMETSP1384-20130603/5410_1 /TAXON_ID=29189 /ORGANISM="Ammonia sp." /LENGTH=153 /DNA_ID=CAMNT_0042453417 /DNA_START=125 /DNA_END=586 /DNA_ORIENTATION=-